MTDDLGNKCTAEFNTPKNKGILGPCTLKEVSD